MLNWNIVLFDTGFDLQHTFEARQEKKVEASKKKTKFPSAISLRSHSMIGYSLHLKLIRAESLRK